MIRRNTILVTVPVPLTSSFALCLALALAVKHCLSPALAVVGKLWLSVSLRATCSRDSTLLMQTASVQQLVYSVSAPPLTTAGVLSCAVEQSIARNATTVTLGSLAAAQRHHLPHSDSASLSVTTVHMLDHSSTQTFTIAVIDTDGTTHTSTSH